MKKTLARRWVLSGLQELGQQRRTFSQDRRSCGCNGTVDLGRRQIPITTDGKTLFFGDGTSPNPF